VDLLSINISKRKTEKLSIFAFIPARSGSKGVPDKNVKLLGDHPLIEWSIAACKKAASINRIIVSTDSEEYAQISREAGAEVPFLRPVEIAGDRSTDYDFIEHALDWFSKNGGAPDYIVHIRPTTPFRDPLLIDKAVAAFISHPQATALRSVHPMSESAYKTFEIAPGGQLKRVASESTELDAANNARQQFPTTYNANGYVDVLSTAFIRKMHLIHGDHVLSFTTPMVNEVDTEEDFSILEMELQNHPEFATRLFK
jgi:N-acylneuraminate cytidylyltransferase